MRNSDSNIFDLQSSIRSLVNERRTLQARLTQDRRKRSFTGNVQRIGVDSTNLRSWKRQREIQAPLSQDPNQVNKAETTEVPAFPVEKRPKVSLDDSTIKRTKNMFGSLLGHLQKAKSKLDDEATQRPAEMQRAVTQQVDHMLQLEKKNLAELRRRDFQERQSRDLQRIREIQRQLREKETRILELHLIQHFGTMKGFIRTDATPMIFWLPAQHNEVTLKAQNATAEAIERKLQSIKEKFATGDKWINDDLPMLKTDNLMLKEEIPQDEDHAINLHAETDIHPGLMDDEDSDLEEQAADGSIDALTSDSNKDKLCQPLPENCDRSDDLTNYESCEDSADDKRMS